VFLNLYCLERGNASLIDAPEHSVVRYVGFSLLECSKSKSVENSVVMWARGGGRWRMGSVVRESGGWSSLMAWL
jgi:hypothetical protein